MSCIEYKGKVYSREDFAAYLKAGGFSDVSSDLIQKKTNDLSDFFDESENITSAKDLPFLVDKAKKSLSKLFPDVKIILHDNEESYAKAVGESYSNGAFINNTIHINRNKANGRTLAHEVFHAVLLNMVKSDPEAQRVTAAMITAIEKVLPADMKAKLQDFVENGYDSQKELWDEEKLAELVGYLADNYTSLSQPAKNIIKEWLDKLAKLVGIKEFTDKEVIDFMNTLASKVASGEVITEKDVELFNGGVKIKNPIKFLTNRFQFGNDKVKIDVEYVEQNKMDSLIKSGLVSEVSDLSGLNGMRVVTTSPDDMFVGSIKINGETKAEGNGGVYFVTKFGDVWAMSNKGVANGFSKAINEASDANGGKSYVALVKGTDAKLVSSSQGVTSSLVVVESMLDAGLISLSDFRSAIREAVKTAEGKISLSPNGSAKDLKSELDAFFKDVNSSTFERRGNVLKGIISNIAKSKSFQSNKDEAIKFLNGDTSKGIGVGKTPKSQSLVDLVAQVSAEKLTKGLNTGDVYAVIEIDGKVDVIEDEHQSYPFHIKVIDENGNVSSKKPKLILPKNRQNGKEILTSIDGKNSKELGIKFSGSVGATANMPYSKGIINTNALNEKPSRKQIIGEKAIKDKVVQDNLTVAKEMESANKSAEDIFIATGWEKGVDGKWRYDLNEGNVELKKLSGEGTYSFEEVVNYPELLKAYPDAKKIKIKFINSDNIAGAYYQESNKIDININQSEEELKSTLLHEIQHWVQNKEGFLPGGNPTIARKYVSKVAKNDYTLDERFFNFVKSIFSSKQDNKKRKERLDRLKDYLGRSDQDLYESIAGEVEARNVEKRATMTPEERRSEPISKTEPISREGQIVIDKSSKFFLNQPRKQVNKPSVDEIYEESNKAIRDLEKTRGYKEFLNDVYKRIFERQKNIKDLMLSFGNTYAKNAYNRLVTKSGASGYASFEFKEAAKKIYGGLKKSDLVYLDKIIYAKRIKSINEKRIKEGRPLYKGMKGYSLEEANADLAKIKNELGDKKFEDLNNRASEYFNEYRKSLRDLYDFGRISKETYDTFKNDEYSPIKTIKYILSPNTSTEEIDSEAKRFGMAKKDIMKLGDENDNAIIMDSKWLLATTINANKTRAFENKMLDEFNKAFESLSKEEKESISDYIVENPVIGKKKDGSLKYKYDTVDLPNGFKKVSFFENGNKKDIIIDKNYADQLLDVKTKYRALEILGTATGAGVLRFFATGGNPLFIFGNIANDFQNILYNTDVYSGFLPLATVQIARDFVKNFVKKAIVNDTYNSTYKEYLSHGGALEQMSRDGLQALESRNTTNKIAKGAKKGLLATGNFLSYLGNTSETAFRLAVYDKYKEKLIKEFQKQNGRTPNNQELDDIMWDAARESRETMPFDQGGDLAKTANILLPYLNAGLQGIRKFAVFAAKNPKRFARNIIQYTAMSSALSATSFAMLLMGIRNDDEDDEKSLKEMIRAWQSVSNYEKANYHIIFTGNKNKDGEYEYYRIKKIPVFSILSTASEEALLKSFLNSKGVDYKFDSDPVGQAALKSIPFPIDVQEWLGRNPTAGAFISYWANKDTFTGEKIFREPRGKKILPEAEVNNKTNQVYIDLGKLTGLSPAKSKVAVEKIITAETTNPAIPLMYSAYDGLFHKKDGFGKEVSDAMSSVVDAFGKKVVRYTNKDIISYKKQDELEYKEAVIETEIWKKEQKVYDEIKEVYSSGKKLDRNGFKKIIESNFDPIDREKYAKKYKAYINNMGSDREILDIIFEDVPEVQAMKINERYGNSFDEEERKELEEVSRKSERPISRKAIEIYYSKYKERKASN